MPYLRRTILICNMLLVAVLTSVFGVASASSFTYMNHSDSTESFLRMEAPALDCQNYDDLEMMSLSKYVWKEVLRASSNETKAAHHCCSAINTITFFPATLMVDPKPTQSYSLALVHQEKTSETDAFSENIFRPPIG